MASNRLIPLLILFVVVAILVFIGVVIYGIMMSVKAQTKAKMEKKHVVMTRGGMKVGVRELNDEEYKDKSQSVLVNIWNHSSFPAAKNRWWGNGGGNGNGNGNGKKHS